MISDSSNTTVHSLRKQELLYINVYGDQDDEMNLTSSAIFNRRPEFQAEAAASLTVTTVIIGIILSSS